MRNRYFVFSDGVHFLLIGSYIIRLQCPVETRKIGRKSENDYKIFKIIFGFFMAGHILRQEIAECGAGILYSTT